MLRPMSDAGSNAPIATAFNARRIVTLILGPVLGLVTWLLLHFNAPGLAPQAAFTAGVGVWMGIWWMTEALPIEATGLLPIVVFPLLGLLGTTPGAFKVDAICAPYATDIIFLFLGGMIIGLAIERSGLHRRFALGVVRIVGASPRRLIGGFLFATAFISMWVSNAAATVMMMPIALSVCALLDRTELSLRDGAGRKGFEASMLLAVAFGASIGGVGTLVGTPPMAQMAGFLKDSVGVELTFASWLKIGLPVIAVMLPAAWAAITLRGAKVPTHDLREVHTLVSREIAGLGPMRWPEWAALCVFALAVGLWVTSALHHIPDAVVAISAAMILFILPWDRKWSRQLISWDDASSVPWGVLVMFGGGLSLAATISRSGLDKAIADAAGGLTGASLLVVLFVVAMGSVVLTEFASNTALTAAGLPVVAALSVALGVPPVPACMTMALAASLGFMLPAGTAPNALVFGSGRVTMRHMMKIGLRLDILAAILVPLVVWGAWKMGMTPA